jgi:hypothetical protein
MANTLENIDIEKAKKMAEHVFDVLSGALVSGMIYLGDRMGLYQALNGAGAVTSEELARKTGLHERWIREWLYGQAAANLIDYKGEGRFELSPESALVLANEDSPFFLAGGFCALPQQMAVLNLLPESFKSGMGLTYDQLGPDVNRGVERLLAPWFRTQLVPIALPKLDGVVAKLQAGAKVADVGCGAGVALIEMAKAYPRSDFTDTISRRSRSPVHRRMRSGQALKTLLFTMLASIRSPVMRVTISLRPSIACTI